MRAATILLAMALPALAGEVPDLQLTPGVVTDATVETICATKWGRDARHVTAAMRSKVFAEYNLSGPNDPMCRLDKSRRRFEIDHLVSRELGGADDVSNLWPQCYAGKWNAVMKDRLENRLHKEVCAGRLTLPEARSMIVEDWRKAWIYYFGKGKSP